MTDASGKPVTVKVDKDFKVTSTESGPGPGGRHGDRGPDGARTPPTTTSA